MYNKLFTKILDSSIWLEPIPTRIVWITLIAAMDEDGYAHFSAVENLASRARVTVTQCNAAITTLASPDKNSSDSEFEGRRIERVPGGFVILNATKYRAIGNGANRRESTRLRVQRFREKNAKKDPVTPCNADVTPSALHPAVAVEYASESEIASSPKGESEGEVRPDKFSQARIALHWLNEKAGRHYRETASNLQKIQARLDEVKDLEGVKMMIDRQCARWKCTEQAEYLRPETLFGTEKFNSYYDNRDLPVAEPKKNGHPESKQIREGLEAPLFKID